MPPRNNPLEEYFNQFVDVRRVVEPTERNPVWATTNGFRAQRTYIDEMADHWRTHLEEEIRERILDAQQYIVQSRLQTSDCIRS